MADLLTTLVAEKPEVLGALIVALGLLVAVVMSWAFGILLYALTNKRAHKRLRSLIRAWRAGRDTR